jgi:hypothetical protein
MRMELRLQEEPGHLRLSDRVEVCCGDDVDDAVAITKSVIVDYFGAGSEETYSVWARGEVDWRDIVVDDYYMNSCAVISRTLSRGYPLGKPYKRSHLPGTYTLFGVVGLRYLVDWCGRVVVDGVCRLVESGRRPPGGN